MNYRKSIPNFITLGRFILSIVLIFMEPLSTAFYIVFALCGITDMADGICARMLHAESEKGAILDSIADAAFVLVTLIKLLPVLNMKPLIWTWIAIIAAIKVVDIIIGYIMTKHIVFLHTNLNKITGALLFILPFTVSFIDINWSVLPVCAVATVAALQEGNLILNGRFH